MTSGCRRMLHAPEYVEGDACFAASRQGAVRLPHLEYVYMKIRGAQATRESRG